MVKKFKTGKELIREIEELGKRLAEKGIGSNTSKPGISRISSEILNKNEVFLAESQKLSHTGSWYLDLASGELTWSDEVYQILGIESTKFKATYDSFFDFVHPDDRAGVDEAYKKSIAEGKDTYETEHRVIRRNSNEIIYVIERCIHIRSDEGTVVASLGIVQDISANRKATLELEEKEMEFRILFENLPQGVVFQAADGRITSANKSAEQILGLPIWELTRITSEDPRWKIVREDGSEFPENEYPSMVSLHTGLEVKNVIMGVLNPQINGFTWINLSASPLFREGSSKPYKVITTFEKITSNKLKQSE